MGTRADEWASQAVMYCLERSQLLPRTLEDVFGFFSRAENLQAITPPWLDFRIIGEPPSQLHAGARIQYGLRWRKIPLRWTTEISGWDPPYRFVDEQIRGPYHFWRHEHRFNALGSFTRMTDTVHYELPFGLLGRLVHSALVRRDVNFIFDYRARTIARQFAAE